MDRIAAPVRSKDGQYQIGGKGKKYPTRQAALSAAGKEQAEKAAKAEVKESKAK